jgi:hypothetical protein
MLELLDGRARRARRASCCQAGRELIRSGELGYQAPPAAKAAHRLILPAVVTLFPLLQLPSSRWQLSFLLIMPKSKIKSSSTLRRSNTLLKIFLFSYPAMRPCKQCLDAKVACVVSPDSDLCQHCFRTNNRRCELAPPLEEMDKSIRRIHDLQGQILESKAKTLRLKKLKQKEHDKLKALGRRETQNIEELEMDEAAAAAAADVDPSSFSPTGFSQVSFSGLLDSRPLEAAGSFSGASPAPRYSPRFHILPI